VFSRERNFPQIISKIQDEARLWVQAGNKHLDMLLSGAGVGPSG